ncbi:MAG: ABC transporter permease subunit [Candidatus Cloacimonetes bacterium]|nr:ABC transporter permease subunit [Candidatus Cloacimonadota bacterium]
MNWNKVKVIYFKEMLDLFRDRRTIITSVLLPIILYPFISMFIASVASRQETKLTEAVKTVYFYDNTGSAEADLLYEKLSQAETLDIKHTRNHSWNDNFRELVESNNIQAFISLEDSTAGEFQHLLARIYYNDTDEKSQKAYVSIRETINKTNWEIVSQRLRDINLDEEILSAVDYAGDSVAAPQQILGALLGKFLAYMLIVLTLSSGSVVASDLVAGEKERGTLETILVSAVSRLELVTGKFLTIITFSFITVFMNIFSMYISTRHILGMAEIDMSQVQVPFLSFIMIFVAMIPLATLFAGIQLSLSTYSRNIKECSSYQMPLLIIGMMFSMISIFPGFELNYGYALIPIMNFSLLLKNILIGEYHLGYFITVIASNLILALVALRISVSLFNKEEILFRTKVEKSFKFWGTKRHNIFEPGFIAIIFGIVLLLFYYLGASWQTTAIVPGLIKTELLIVLLPVLLIYRLSKNSLPEGARLKATRPVNYLLMLLAVIPGFIIAAYIMQLTNLLFPLPASYLESMQKIMEVHQLPLVFSFLVMGFLPGICEEMLFRGYIIRGFERFGKWQAIIITGIMFGIFHLDFFRFLPAAAMGIWLGYLLLKTGSIYITIIAHTLHNSFTIVLSRWGEQLPILSGIVKNDNIPLWLLLVSMVAITFIAYYLEKFNPNVSPEHGTQSFSDNYGNSS